MNRLPTYSEIYEELGQKWTHERCKALRLKIGRNIAEMAVILNINVHIMEEYERPPDGDRKGPSPEILRRYNVVEQAWNDRNLPWDGQTGWDEFNAPFYMRRIIQDGVLRVQLGMFTADQKEPFLIPYREFAARL